MTAKSSTFIRKIHSLLQYRRVFVDWRVAASLRYSLKEETRLTRLRLRGRGAIWVRPKYNKTAVGEVFIAETYGELLPATPPKRVWDIGGNIGCFAIWLLRRFPEAQITSFEPSAPTFELLAKNQAEWEGAAWQIRPFGLSEKDQTVNAFIPFESYGQTSRHATSGEAIQLNLRNIATVWEEEGRPSIDLLKIDCEGDEYEILAAMPEGLWNSVQTVLLEVHPRENKSPEELRNHFIAHGFSVLQGVSNPELWRATRNPA
ncbi:MAG: FkbM family methyltransferase [Kiritimatiellae bacterium]|nr:FkbM family methyltransferase [Kiritimatiellia bacterium]